MVASLTSSLVNFRLELLRRMVASGAEITAYAPDREPQTEATLAAMGIRFVRIPMARTGINPIEDIATLLALWRDFRRWQPDIVFPYTMKPIIYGNIAARLAGIEKSYALCTGLGYSFIERDMGHRKRMVKAVSVWLYRLAFRRTSRIFVYNEADREEIRRHRLAPDRKGLVHQLPGSGVDTLHFGPAPPISGPPVFLMVARLLRDKGVREYAEACRIIRSRFPEVTCRLIGPFDSNPSAISPADVDGWVKERIVEYLGEVRDVRPHLKACSVLVLPSYREGLSRTVLEAMSTGRSVITSDAPGCPDPVEDGLTGFVVPVRDATALADAMTRFVTQPGLSTQMGTLARARVLERYDVHIVNDLLMQALGLEEAGI